MRSRVGSARIWSVAKCITVYMYHYAYLESSPNSGNSCSSPSGGTGDEPGTGQTGRFLKYSGSEGRRPSRSRSKLRRIKPTPSRKFEAVGKILLERSDGR